MTDLVNQPPHYKNHPSGVETIDLAEQMPHLLATAFAYIERSPYKGTELQDLQKARWYIKRFIGGTKGGMSDLARFTRFEDTESLSAKLAFLGFAMGDRSIGARYPTDPDTSVGKLACEILDLLDARIVELEEKS